MLEQMRIRGVRQIRLGVHPEDVAAALGLDRSTVYAWKAAYERGGEAALAAKPHPGKPSRLTQTQLDELFALITEHDPRDYGSTEHLWTRDLVADLMAEVFDVRFSAQWTGRILRRLGLSPQRPKYRASEQDPGAVTAWREQVYPAIRAEAAQVGATIYFGDEAGVSVDHHAGTTWAPVGQTPVAQATAQKSRVNMVSAIEQRGRIHFEVSEGSFNSDSFIGFCRKLLADDGGKVFLIVDNSRIHHAKAVFDYVGTTGGQLKLFFLPTYAPELNPDEWVWKHVKHDNVGKRALRDPKHHFHRVYDALAWLRGTPEMVRAFFRDPHLAYLTPKPAEV
jgi:transposase